MKSEEGLRNNEINEIFVYFVIFVFFRNPLLFQLPGCPLYRIDDHGLISLVAPDFGVMPQSGIKDSAFPVRSIPADRKLFRLDARLRHIGIRRIEGHCDLDILSVEILELVNLLRQFE